MGEEAAFIACTEGICCVKGEFVVAVVVYSSSPVICLSMWLGAPSRHSLPHHFWRQPLQQGWQFIVGDTKFRHRDISTWAQCRHACIRKYGVYRNFGFRLDSYSEWSHKIILECGRDCRKGTSLHLTCPEINEHLMSHLHELQNTKLWKFSMKRILIKQAKMQQQLSIKLLANEGRLIHVSIMVKGCGVAKTVSIADNLHDPSLLHLFSFFSMINFIWHNRHILFLFA